MAAPLLPLLLATLAQEPASQLSEAELAFFEKEVRPVLVEHCYECHSDAKKRPKGGLRLDTRAGWTSGGDSGPALVSGDVEASLLVRAVRYTDPEVEMPPDGKLPEAAIRTLEEWVRRGAPDPRTAVAPAATVAPAVEQPPHWAFQRMADPLPPPVAGEARVVNEIDRFVLARLEGAGLTLAPEADRRTLLRRASQDLVGLPPTAEELDRFATDPAP
ncbi:MAG: c-type cytochrome domain-containing protein, partial [Planctomycetota bacterium]